MADLSHTIRPFRDEDLPAVLELMRVALGETELLARTPELFAWKHFHNPFGRSLILVAEADRRIVGLRAFMRWQLVTPSGEALSCVRAVDTATHPEYQRRGIFRGLTLEAVRLASEEGVDLVFNTPNPQSGAGYLSMGWVSVGEIGALARPTARLLRGITNTEPPPAPPGSRPAAEAPLERLSTRPPNGLRTPRTPAYLRWRFGAHPTARYSVVQGRGGTAIVRSNLRRGRAEMIISELVGGAAGPALRRARRGGRVDYLVAWFSPGSPERRAAIRAGLLPLPRVTALTLVARPLRPLGIDVSTMASWDLAIGDLELL